MMSYYGVLVICIELTIHFEQFFNTFCLKVPNLQLYKRYSYKIYKMKFAKRIHACKIYEYGHIPSVQHI